VVLRPFRCVIGGPSFDLPVTPRNVAGPCDFFRNETWRRFMMTPRNGGPSTIPQRHRRTIQSGGLRHSGLPVGAPIRVARFAATPWQFRGARDNRRAWFDQHQSWSFLLFPPAGAMRMQGKPPAPGTRALAVVRPLSRAAAAPTLLRVQADSCQRVERASQTQPVQRARVWQQVEFKGNRVLSSRGAQATRTREVAR